MKALYIGGVKSGKSKAAEARILELGSNPIYLATTEIMDEEIKERVLKHQEQRGNAFELIEEPLEIDTVLAKQTQPVLVECLSMWLNNMLFYKKSDKEILDRIDKLLQNPADRVFVLNDVGSGIIPMDPLSRKFVDLSGIIAQILAKQIDEVYHCIAGIATRIK